MFGSGQKRWSTSGPEHRLSSSPETGRPESRSKQARKRLWIETTLLPLTAPVREVLDCREAQGRQGEHGVQADQALRTTEFKKNKQNYYSSVIKLDRHHHDAGINFL